MASGCIICAGEGTGSEGLQYFQESELIFILQLLKNDLGSKASDIINIFIALTPDFYGFCSLCHSKVVETKGIYESLRQAQGTLTRTILSAYRSNPTDTLDALSATNQLRSVLVEHLILNGGCSEEIPASWIPEPEKVEELELLGDDVSFQEEDVSDQERLVVASPETPVLLRCSVNVGPALFPHNCSDCSEQFWTKSALATHMKTHGSTRQRRSRLGRRRARQGSRRKIRNSKGSLVAPHADTDVDSDADVDADTDADADEQLPMLDFQAVVKKMYSLAYPASCRNRVATSEAQAAGGDVAKEGHSEEEENVLKTLEFRPLPSRCPLDHCWADKSKNYNTLTLLEEHVLEHFQINRLGSIADRIEPSDIDLRAEFLAANQMSFPARCPKTFCQSETLYESEMDYRLHLRHDHFQKSTVDLESTKKEIKIKALKVDFRRAEALSFPAKCFLDKCASSKKTFEDAASLRRHLWLGHYGHVDLDRSDWECNWKLAEEEERVLEGVEQLAIPAKCPLEECHCLKKYFSHDVLRAHVQTYFKSKVVHFPFIAPGAGRGPGSTRLSLLRHRQSEEDQTLEQVEDQSETGFQHKCDVCGREFRFRKSRDHHRKVMHGARVRDRQFQCEDCGKTFSTKHAYKEHRVMRHSETPPPHRFLCSFCAKTFKTKQQLKQHSMIWHRHNQENNGEPFRCSNCPKLFFKRSQLEAHERRVHWRKLKLDATKCDLCNKMFASAVSLETHKKCHSHSSEPAQFACSECPMRKRTKLEMDLHVAAVHREERPFSCDTCGMTFKIWPRLKQHQHTHSRLHHCPTCAKTYPTPSKLRQHHHKAHGTRLET